MRNPLNIFLSAAALLCLIGVQATAQPVEADELLVSAAISLRSVLTELGKEFERRNPGNRILFNFGSSGTLARQIEQGAATDVFISASDREIGKLRKEQLLLEKTINTLAGNALVVAVPTESVCIEKLSDLAKLERVAIGNPNSVPAGHYAEQALTTAGIYSTMKAGKKLVLAESARQIVEYVSSGNVDAGIVYVTDMQTSKHIKQCFRIPKNCADPIVYLGAVTALSKNVNESQQFVQFLATEKAKTVFRIHGFLPAP